ncbi:alpha-L-glutamate ligase-like protein [Francisellaceae bacterium]|nr:alpha-L-glutamate ligase-like protein [Francisellaceae bacterium]
MLGRWGALKKMGVLGINNRNINFIQKLNDRRYYPLVDNKILTKEMAIENNIAAPELYAAVKSEHDNKNLESFLKNHNSFVIKPAQGAGGEGIIVVTGQVNNRFKQASGRMMDMDQMRYHVSNILSGTYSLGGHPDVAMVEYLIQFDALFNSITYQGAPDVRIIVICGFPVMAMARLPTRESSGKANLHQGAIGAGIDLKTGITMNGVWHNEIVTHHPDTENPISGLEIPKWHDFLEIASKCYDLTNLGYLGIDIILDKDKGPLMLELNARPGLNIQIANEKGIEGRYNRIKDKIPDCKNMSYRERIDYVLNLENF